VFGGGVAQVATTLYLAVKNRSDIVITELDTYDEKFVEDYVDNGEDAVITDYKAGTDFRFVSRYNGTLAIAAYVVDNYLYVRVYPDNDYKWEDEEKVYSLSKVSTPINGTYSLYNNIELAADAIYGTVLSPRETFSFNERVGPRTEQRGFESAVNGRGVKVIGGGVAQIASTVYLAVKDLDCVKLLDVRTYGEKYNQNYVDDADDAIVTDYNADIDFSFVYTGYGRLVIYTYVDGDRAYCEVYEKFN